MGFKASRCDLWLLSLIQSREAADTAGIHIAIMLPRSFSSQAFDKSNCFSPPSQTQTSSCARGTLRKGGEIKGTNPICSDWKMTVELVLIRTWTTDREIYLRSFSLSFSFWIHSGPFLIYFFLFFPSVGKLWLFLFWGTQTSCLKSWLQFAPLCFLSPGATPISGFQR